MQVKTIHYSALINLGNYSNERIGFTAEVSEGESISEIIEKLRQEVLDHAGLNASDLHDSLYAGKRELKELEAKILKAKSEWDATAEFLRAQGIKPDAPNFPLFKNLLPEILEQRTNLTEGEIVEETDGSY